MKQENNLKKSKKAKIIIIIIILLFICIGYKSFMLYIYDVNAYTSSQYQDDIKDLKIGNTYNIKHIDYNDSESIVYKNFKIKNISKDLTENKEISAQRKDLTYSLNTDNKKSPKTLISIGIAESYISRTKEVADSIGNISIAKFNPDKYMKKNNINNDIELLNEIIKRKNNKSNIFTTVDKMRENFTFQMLSQFIPTSNDGYDLITGKNQGIIENNDNFKEISIIKGNKRYYIFCYNLNYFTDDIITEIISSVSIS